MKLACLYFILFFGLSLFRAEEINFKKNLYSVKCIPKGGDCNKEEVKNICCQGLECKTLPSKFGTSQLFYICWDKENSSENKNTEKNLDL
jgi:hypothetical protein